MKVLHIASGRSGGAFRSAQKLCQIQANAGLGASLLTNNDRTVFRKLMSKFITLVNQAVTQPKFGIMSVYSINGLSIKQIRKVNPDIVHIHNWFNLLSVKQIAQISQEFPVVITMHDERLLTGGCHNHLDCDHISNACNSCPAIRLPIGRKVQKSRLESELLLKSKNVKFITPSKWLCNQVKNSTSFFTNPEVIPNPIQMVLPPEEIEFQNPRSGETIKLLFVAANPWVPLKGLSRLLDVLNALVEESHHSFRLEIVGKVTNAVELPPYADLVGEMEGKSLATTIQDADIVIVPSYSENYPGVVIEAQALGRLIVATNVGGIPEMITDLETGLLQREGENLKDLVKRALDLPEDRRRAIGFQAARFVRNHFSEELLLSSVMNVYREAMNRAK